MDKIRVLLADTDLSVCRMFSERLDPFGDIKVDMIYYAEDIAACLSEIYYSVVVVDKKLISEADIEIILNNIPNPEKHPAGTEIILTSDDAVCDSVCRIGDLPPMMLLKKPFDFDLVMMLVRNSDELRRLRCGVYIDDSSKDVKTSVSDALKRIGIPPSLKGYKYLHCAITSVIERPDLLDYITKSLYPEVAQANHTSSTAVERQIRHAIGVSWDRGDVDVLRDCFGYTVSRTRGKPTNSEFISSVASKIRQILTVKK
ncbi:MAG: sporulation initiation factor Spo0A C-terminal domain-containing protein [Clostridia bacterium]|nr:sporulation initiation factor Spo0A C-terminal domain-containing protein [Clostridia bacterium]